MEVRIHAVFDGEVLRPEEPAGLEPNRRYLVTVEQEVPATAPAPEEPAEYPLTALLRVAVDAGVADLAEHHDSYARRR
jgi:hypothetical protein